MSAKLLEFYGLRLNSSGVVYFLMTKKKANTFAHRIDLSDCAVESKTQNILMGIIFGAQQSMVARKVNAATLTAVRPL